MSEFEERRQDFEERRRAEEVRLLAELAAMPSPLDLQRTRHDTRMLVCEGGCNPDLRDYDRACASLHEPDSIRTHEINFRMVRAWARRLKHTTHARIRGEHWHIRHGWVRTFRCERCGGTKLF